MRDLFEQRVVGDQNRRRAEALFGWRAAEVGEEEGEDDAEVGQEEGGDEQEDEDEEEDPDLILGVRLPPW